ncbi:hypothetical protein AL714_10740 [Clostridium botulinum]|uniref:hypothetical protein n=1 Tax=Clostridium botulinum TaxID=1491 RepID=UPI00099C964D|nr:hypothetical protein [Clostridium botulinum]OPD36990.1 hypothetical protein AL714_10740 [Clostridium botulinum]
MLVAVFMVEVKVIGTEKYYVKANTKEDAIKIVKNGGEMLGEVEQDLEFVTNSFIATEEK